MFTPFSPRLGGGSAQLRSHLRFLPDLQLTWHYLAEQPATETQDNWNWLGQRFTPGELLGDFSLRTGFLPGSKARVRALLSRIDADLYWVVGHYEGIAVAAELCEQGKPVHLTVHDDPFGTWTRSSRYRVFRPLLNRVYPRLLRRARSVDVTSWGMRNLYRHEYGVNCFSVYLHVPELPRLSIAPDPSALTVGHIGTLYRAEPFRRFLAACKNVAAEQKRILRVLTVGSSAELDAVVAGDPAIFRPQGELTEDAAVSVLASCDLLYAMYPEGSKYERFRRTSLPIKLSTYVQAQRPVFAHAPLDSTLARIVGPYGIGAVCSSPEVSLLRQQIKVLLGQPFPRENFERIRRELMGPEQLLQLGAALQGRDWRAFSEFDFPLRPLAS